MHKAILIDTRKCTGCRACQVACKQWNELPAEKTEFKGTYQNPPDLSVNTYTIVKFNEIGIKRRLSWLFRKHQCMQCTEATCIKVCPVKAITKHEEGFKVRDLNKCIGCGLCVSMCPFSVPKLDEKEKKAKDCLFCINRVANKMEPACVKACPSEALQFGERREIMQVANTRLLEVKEKSPKAYLYGEKELGGLGVMTIITENPKVYDLPENPKVAEHVQALEEFYRLVGIKNQTRDTIVKLVASWADEHGVKQNAIV